ncbi:uncharacterized protein LOC126843295 isoform X2 [Adelges cooleyi]|uniref:uncharacterized protein LOC126843295 isoform X2 n=1 Tax=Adelges cooleyi TaxID=133065 RepID=UPI0021801C3B|nr:uncharacterized protein LOC126843295 isoform X2 [Adelges cooleyi]
MLHVMCFVRMRLVHAACLLSSVFLEAAFVLCSLTVKRHDICRPNSQRSVFTAIGSRGVVYAKNGDQLVRSNFRGSLPGQCSLHIVSCPSCMVNVRFKDVNLTCAAGYDLDVPSSFEQLKCNSICIVEPPYLATSLRCVNATAKKPSIHYKSLTSQVNINFVHTYPYGHAFTAEYLITRNTQLAEMKPELDSTNTSLGGFISTPFFPSPYADDLSFEQVIDCKSDAECKIQLIFVDFLIAHESTVEFYDSDRKRLDTAEGALTRPPALLTSGPTLYVKFFANGVSSVGYKAQYSFIHGNIKNSILRPNTNCGGFVENKGGAITMMNMVSETEPDIMFDCIWLFRLSKKYETPSKWLMYMKVIAMDNLIDSDLTICEGPTSEGQLLQWNNGSHFTELLMGTNVGYYVRLVAAFNSSSRFEIAYAAYSRSRSCTEGNEFACKNGRCIANRLHCDGFDHCGDNSDESRECFDDRDGEVEFTDKSWYPYKYKSNYYFPNNTLYLKRYHVLMGCFLGLVLLFFIILFTVYRIASRYHFQTELQNRLISISQLLLDGVQLHEEYDSTSEVGRTYTADRLSDDPPPYESPPEYEPPPNYEEAIKMYQSSATNKTIMDHEIIGVHLEDNNGSNDGESVQALSEKDEDKLCLCCCLASYQVLALDLIALNKCCLGKLYSFRKSTINNQY